MKFSVLFNSLNNARVARQKLAQDGVLRWSDRTSIHHRRIRVDRLPFEHTSARLGAVLGAIVVGFASACILAAVAASGRAGFDVATGLVAGLAAGMLFGGVFGAIAYSTRPADFIRRKRDAVRRGRALVVCDIPDTRRAERARVELESAAAAVPS